MADCAQGLKQAATLLSEGDSDLCGFILAGVEAQVDVLAPRHPYPRLPAACPHTYKPEFRPDCQRQDAVCAIMSACVYLCASVFNPFQM